MVPVYVLSLADQPYGMLFDGESFVAADRDMVVILQLVTPVQSEHDGTFAVNSPFVVEGACLANGVWTDWDLVPFPDPDAPGRSLARPMERAALTAKRRE